MGRVGATQVFVYVMKPLVILAFFDETFVAVLLLLDYEPTDKLPSEPSVAGGRAFGKP